MSNTPKPLRIVKGSWRIIKPEVNSRLSDVVVPEVWETISYDMETHTGSQFVSVCDKGLKTLSNRHESTRIEQLVTTNDDPPYRMSICRTLIPQVSVKGDWRCCRIDTIRQESKDSSPQMTTRHTGCRFARNLENIPQVSVKGGCRYYRIDTIQLESNESSQQMTTRHTVESTRANRQRSTEYLLSCANRHPVWRIVICCDESFDSSQIVSNRQHFLYSMVQKILTMELQSFHAFRTWEVHVFLWKSTSGVTDGHLLWRVVRCYNV